MRSQKGFTLVELMGVLVVLGVLLLVTVPSMTSTFRNSSEEEEKEYVKTLCMAARTYIEVDKDAQSQTWTSRKTLSTSTLKENGYITNSLVNPDTDTLDGSIEVQKVNGGLTCWLGGIKIEL